MLKINEIKWLDNFKMNENEYQEFSKSLQILDKSAFKEHFMDVKDLKYEFIENPFSIILLVLENEKILGYLDFWVTFDSATIFRIAVDEKYQRNGVGSALFNKMYEILSSFEEKIVYLTLEVRETNLKAIKFYEKHGFAKIIVKPNYYGENENAIYMMKGVE